MFLDERVKEEIKKIITERINLPHYRLFIFGSRASGTATERSDIDIGIEGDVSIPSSDLFDIKEELDNIRIMQKIDFVDFKTVDESFKKIALEHTEVLYER